MGKRSRLWCAVLAACFLTAMFTGCSRDPNVRKQKYLESGNRYYEKGKYREAAIQYENAIQVDARFEGSRGTGRRTQRRTCDLTFAKH